MNKITNKRINDKVAFKDLLIGNPFVYENNAFMRINPYCSERLNVYLPAVNLETGATHLFDKDCMVDKVSIEVIVSKL